MAAEREALLYAVELKKPKSVLGFGEAALRMYGIATQGTSGAVPMTVAPLKKAAKADEYFICSNGAVSVCCWGKRCIDWPR